VSAIAASAVMRLTGATADRHGKGSNRGRKSVQLAAHAFDAVNADPQTRFGKPGRAGHAVIADAKVAGGLAVSTIEGNDPVR